MNIKFEDSDRINRRRLRCWMILTSTLGVLALATIVTVAIIGGNMLKTQADERYMQIEKLAILAEGACERYANIDILCPNGRYEEAAELNATKALNRLATAARKVDLCYVSLRARNLLNNPPLPISGVMEGGEINKGDEQ